MLSLNKSSYKNARADFVLAHGSALINNLPLLAFVLFFVFYFYIFYSLFFIFMARQR